MGCSSVRSFSQNPGSRAARRRRRVNLAAGVVASTLSEA